MENKKHSNTATFINAQLQILSFNIENTVGSIGKATDVGGIGIDNVRKRLDILYNGSYVLNIDQTDCLYKVYLLINIS